MSYDVISPVQNRILDEISSFTVFYYAHFAYVSVYEKKV